MWFSRSVLSTLLKTCVASATVCGVCSYDEASIRSKARCVAATYLPTKPDKYAIRLYCNVEWSTTYLQSFFDNGAGNKGLPPSDRYLSEFPTLRTAFNKCMEQLNLDDSLGDISEKSASALWILMMGHSHNMASAQKGQRLVVTDNFYTRHHLANALLQFTDGDVRILGTVRMNYVDSVNNGNVKKAVQLLKDQPRGTWYLIAAYNRDPNYNKEKKWQQAETWNRIKGGNDANTPAFIPAGGVRKEGWVHCLAR